MSDLPEAWARTLESKGVHSRRALAAKAGIAPQTALRLVDGVGTPSPTTVKRVADALFDGDRSAVWALFGDQREDHGDFELPPEASQLDSDQRAAIVAVVRAMLPADPRKRAIHAGSGRTATLLHVASNEVDVVTSAKSRQMLMELLADDRDPETVKVLALDMLRGGLLSTDDVTSVFDAAERASERKTPQAARTMKSSGRALRRLQDEDAEVSQEYEVTPARVIDPLGTTERPRRAADRRPTDGEAD